LTDQCLKSILPLKKLIFLNVSRTKITMHGVLQLKGLPLKTLYRSDQPATLADMALLRQTFPGMVLSQKAKKQVDSETTTLYAPVH
jgi:hypothetical protein